MTTNVHIIEAEKDAQRTRFLVGCYEATVPIRAWLEADGFRIVEQSFGPAPVRPDVERHRAETTLIRLSGL